MLPRMQGMRGEKVRGARAGGGSYFCMARGSMTRSSIVAAVVVTLWLGLLIWWRGEHLGVQHATRALTPFSGAMPRARGAVTVVGAARSAPPAPFIQPPAVVRIESTGDAGAAPAP